MEATVEAFPGEAFPGKVEFIQPHLDPATRTRRSSVRPGEPRPSAAARHVRHGNAQDAGRRYARFPRRRPPRRPASGATAGERA